MKIIEVRVAPKSSRIKVEQAAQGLKVHLTRPAQDNQANEQLVEVLAEYFKVKKYQVEIIAGPASRNKVVRIHDAASSSRKQ
ncbi:MAG: DUF167 domain-containing protein [Candidatus Omnitrophica bacterium]|nr:DUF167 domain-containing protein [Candidatus Omnitrophota bacterium]